MPVTCMNRRLSLGSLSEVQKWEYSLDHECLRLQICKHVILLQATVSRREGDHDSSGFHLPRSFKCRLL